MPGIPAIDKGSKYVKFSALCFIWILQCMLYFSLQFNSTCIGIITISAWTINYVSSTGKNERHLYLPKSFIEL